MKEPNFISLLMKMVPFLVLLLLSPKLVVAGVLEDPIHKDAARKMIISRSHLQMEMTLAGKGPIDVPIEQTPNISRLSSSSAGAPPAAGTRLFFHHTLAHQRHRAPVLSRLHHAQNPFQNLCYRSLFHLEDAARKMIISRLHLQMEMILAGRSPIDVPIGSNPPGSG
ncbi:hypothetical protein ACFX2F_004316 [Malus domestica]